MHGKRLIGVVTALAVAVSVATVDSTATAGKGSDAVRPLVTGFADPGFSNEGEANAGSLLDKSIEAGASIVRIEANWAGIAPATPANPQSPDDPVYEFDNLDRAVQSASARGLSVLLNVSKAPRWAEGNAPEGSPSGSRKPNPAAFGDFGAALARRYSGDFSGLPRVRYFEAWNEPNLATYLAPQYEGKSPVGAIHYRSMLNAFYAAIKSVNADDKVLTGGTAPYGDRPGGQRTRPLAFLRAMFCLKRDLKATKCPEKANFDILAHHPINTSGGPRLSAINRDDASTPDFKNVAKVLRAAERRGTVGSPKHHRLWATELWWESNPPDQKEGVPLRVHANYTQESLYLLWKQHADVAINLQIQDTTLEQGNPFADESTGLFFSSGKRKPAFRAFQFPLVGDRTGRKSRVWGKSPESGRLAIQMRKGKAWRTVRKLNLNAGDVFYEKIKLPRKYKIRARVAGVTSLTWRGR